MTQHSPDGGGKGIDTGISRTCFHTCFLIRVFDGGIRILDVSVVSHGTTVCTQRYTPCVIGRLPYIPLPRTEWRCFFSNEYVSQQHPEHPTKVRFLLCCVLFK